jgi:membrane associated rhomboid family serine protease
MFPLRDTNPTHRTPYVTLGLIAVNVLIFLFWQPTFGGGENPELAQQTFFWCQGEIPFEVTHQTSLAEGGAEAARAIRADYPGLPPRELQDYLGNECAQKSWLASLFVSMFLHGGWLHIAGNLLFLWIFGNNIEDRLGHVRYLLFYVAGGLAAAALQVAIGPDSTIPNVGASGAIAAVLGAYLFLYPQARVLTAVFFFFITMVELPAIVVLGLWFVLQFLNGVGGLGAEVNGGVAYWAHVGGFVFGFAIALVFLRRRASRRPPWGDPLPPSPF